MCGRYYIDIDAGELRDIVNAAKAGAIPEDMTLKTDGEIFPTNVVPVMTAPGVVKPMQWGFGKPFPQRAGDIAHKKLELKGVLKPRRKGGLALPAKDGTNRGNRSGNYTGAGRKPKPLADKIAAG